MIEIWVNFGRNKLSGTKYIFLCSQNQENDTFLGKINLRKKKKVLGSWVKKMYLQKNQNC